MNEFKKGWPALLAATGMLCDRFGVRRLALPSIALFTLGLAAMTRIGGEVRPPRVAGGHANP